MRTLSRLRTGPIALLFVGIAVLGTGCDGSDKATAKVKGRVKFFDKYLTAGTVTFTSKDGRTGSGVIDVDGNYEVGSAPVGECVITVKVPQIAAPRPGGKGPSPKPPPGVPPMQAPGGGDDTNFMPSNIDPSKIVQIPGKYSSAETSGLSYTVVRGEQTKDITLSP